MHEVARRVQRTSDEGVRHNMALCSSQSLNNHTMGLISNHACFPTKVRLAAQAHVNALYYDGWAGLIELRVR